MHRWPSAHGPKPTFYVFPQIGRQREKWPGLIASDRFRQPYKAARKASRPRDTRDLIVPIGIFKRSAVCS